MKILTEQKLRKMSQDDLVTHILTVQNDHKRVYNSVTEKLTETEEKLSEEIKVEGKRVKSLQSQASRLRKFQKLLNGEVFTDTNSVRSENITPELMIQRIKESQAEIETLKPAAETSLKAYKKIASLQSRISVSRKTWRKLTGKSECPQ